MIVVCLDLEGVLVPEVWINVAEREGIEALRLTTRDIPDYDELMGHRLRVLEEHNLTINHIHPRSIRCHHWKAHPHFLTDCGNNIKS